MAEYIEREALKQKIVDEQTGNRMGNHPAAYKVGYHNGLTMAIAMLINSPTADVAPVVHGRWIHTKKHLWCKDEDGNVDEWRVDYGFHNGPQCCVCGELFCVHCNPNWAEEECEIGHYLCSECGETSDDAHENYCPNCGAHMKDGE